MNKKNFIKALKTKLSILEESEINDIIEEYSNIIEEKMKNGKTEEEAINDFGDIDELSKEILKAYKINPKYVGNDLGRDFESFVKKGATKLTEFTKSIITEFQDGGTIKVESVFEIIIKVVILLIVLAILRIPFMVMSLLGESLLELYFFPMDYVLIFIWNVITWVLYIIACVFIGMAIFKNNIRFENEKPVKKNNTRKKVKNEEKTKKIEEKIEEKKVTVKSDNVTNIAMMIAKIFAFLVLLLPLCLIIIGLCLTITLLIYYIIIGIDLWGLLLILIGMLIFFSHAYHIVHNILERKKNYFLIPLLVSVMFVGVGGIVCFNSIRNFEVIDQSYGSDIEQFEFTIEDETRISITGNLYLKIVDESLLDGQVIVKAYHYEQFVDIIQKNDGNNIKIYRTIKDDFWKVYDEVIENLKDNKFIAYDNWDDVRYEIIANSETLKKVIV